MRRTRSSTCSAFTLVEVLIVVIVLGILAAIVVPQFSDAAQDARLNVTAELVRSVQQKLSEQRVRTGEWPPAIDASWFAERRLPEHPENRFGVPSVEELDTAGILHPTAKVLKAGVGGAFWYNAAEGVFRARVTDQGSAAATLDTYNRVNGCSETELGTYGGGSGGGTGGGS